LVNPIGCLCGADLEAFVAMDAGLSVNADLEEAYRLHQPTEQAKGAYPKAKRPVMNDRNPKNQNHDDGGRHAKIPFKELEWVNVAVHRLISD
jgi:hypothetical protein